MKFRHETAASATHVSVCFDINLTKFMHYSTKKLQAMHVEVTLKTTPSSAECEASLRLPVSRPASRTLSPLSSLKQLPVVSPE